MEYTKNKLREYRQELEKERDKYINEYGIVTNSRKFSYLVGKIRELKEAEDFIFNLENK